MTNQTISELLIIFLCAVSCARIFFRVKSDAGAIIPFFNIFIAVLNLFAWGLNYTDIFLLILTVTIAIWNIRAVLRLSHHLVVDHFTLPFILISLLNLVISCAAGVIIFLYRPVPVNAQKYNTAETTAYYTKDSEGNYIEETDRFGSKKIRIHKYTNSIDGDSDRIILFMPPKACRNDYYVPFYYKLAHDGYTVYTAEIYSKDNTWFKGNKDTPMCRTFYFSKLRRNSIDDYQSFLNLNKMKYLKEYETLFKIAVPDGSNHVFLCCDGDLSQQLNELQLMYPSSIVGNYDLSTCPGYTTPGQGPIENTAPILAKLQGLQKDETLYMSSHIATALENQIEYAISIADQSKN